MESKTTQLDSMCTVLRLKHMSIRTENTSAVEIVVGFDSHSRL